MLLYILRFIYLQYQNILDDISIIIPSNTFFLYTWWQQRYLISDIRWCHAVPAMRELQYLNVFWVGSMDTIHRATNGVKPAWMDSSQRGALRLIQGLKKPMALFFDFHILSVHFHNYFEELKSCTVICFCFLLLHCYCEDLFTKWLKCAIKTKVGRNVWLCRGLWTWWEGGGGMGAVFRVSEDNKWR